jgi:plastocyanin
MKRATLLAFFTALVLFGSAPARAADATIHIDNFAFNPPTLRVSAGTKVTWVNRDDMIHTTVDAATPRAFKSDPMDTDQSYSFVFAKAGTYHYFCSMHPQMMGTIIVE